KSVPGVGNHLFKRLIDRFGAPEKVLAASRAELLSVPGISEPVVSAIRSCKTPDGIDKVLDTCARKAISVITLTDPDYPALLREIPDPPPYLYIMGRLAPDAACVSVVGSRSPTRYGLSMATQLSGDLAAAGLCVVSGMARGIDTAAHAGALDAGGTTWAVLGSGLARIYPPENEKLARRIIEKGALISEFPLSAGPDAHHFPVRNRVISGLSLGTVVVEAAGRSGSLITARLAMEQGREVFAVPGSIQSFKSTGAHNLLKQGATLVEKASDVLAEISHRMAGATLPAAGPTEKQAGPKTRFEKVSPSLDTDEVRVLQTLEPYPVHIDEIARRLSLAPGKTAALLLQLELKGLVIQEPGKRFLLKGD
ncbi:MAG: DNA-processing protein DprA, partial [Thermodesulfobacteriota bacterium]